jgi:hypothetical protein
VNIRFKYLLLNEELTFVYDLIIFYNNFFFTLEDFQTKQNASHPCFNGCFIL